MESFSKLLRNLRVSHMEMLLEPENKEKKEKNQWMKVGEMIFETRNEWVKRETKLRVLYLYGKRRRLGRKVWGEIVCGAHIWGICGENGWVLMCYVSSRLQLIYLCVCFWLNPNDLWTFSWRKSDIKVLIWFDWGVSEIFDVGSRTRKKSHIRGRDGVRSSVS